MGMAPLGQWAIIGLMHDDLMPNSFAPRAGYGRTAAGRWLWRARPLVQETAARGTPAGAKRGAGSAGESAPGTPTPSDERQAAQPSAPVAALLALKAGSRVSLASRKVLYVG